MSFQIKEPKSRVLFLNKQFTQDTIGELTKNIIEINESDRELENYGRIYGYQYTPSPIKIYIDSFGGYVYQMLGLVSVVEKSLTPIHTITTGCAMSCGFMLQICGHKRYGYKHSTFMFHQISSAKWGKIEDIKQDMVESERLQSILENITIDKTQISKNQIIENREKKIDWYMSAEEALKMQVIDEIL